MNRSKIEYCDHTLNIITGCRYKCEYCYARQMSRRFSGNVKMNIKQRDKYRMENGVYVLDEPFLDETGQQVLYPFGFEPTLHRYRYGVLDKLKMGQNILVGAMADMFGEWVPDSWIYDVFNICRQHPKNNYLFLTVNPERYMDSLAFFTLSSYTGRDFSCSAYTFSPSAFSLTCSYKLTLSERLLTLSVIS